MNERTKAEVKKQAAAVANPFRREGGVGRHRYNHRRRSGHRRRRCRRRRGGVNDPCKRVVSTSPFKTTASHPSRVL